MKTYDDVRNAFDNGTVVNASKEDLEQLLIAVGQARVLHPANQAACRRNGRYHAAVAGCPTNINAAGTVAVVLAWLFVVSRYAHAYVHVGSNYVPVRMRLFMVGCVSFSEDDCTN